ncbi:MerR family transcriptional regulator [Ralstonia insidiosa]|nr:MerR family transcriptional regulator [Ralstonia insidiosa]
MRIGELCKRAGVSRDTVRYYERTGLLDKAAQPHATNTYKRYSEVSLQRIRLIIHAKALGFTLAEISDVILSGTVRRSLLSKRLHVCKPSSQNSMKRAGR